MDTNEKNKEVEEKQGDEGSETYYVEVPEEEVNPFSDSSSSSLDSSEQRKLELSKVKKIEEEPPPIFNNDELDVMIFWVQEMTILPGIKPSDWTSDILIAIKQFFLNKDRMILSLYLKGKELRAMNGIPTFKINYLMYFMKIQESIENISPQNLNKHLIIGNTQNLIEETVLEILENVYTPIFMLIRSWPDSVKSVFCSELHQYLCFLKDVHFKMLGITSLYFPYELVNIQIDDAEQDIQLIKRLEGIVIYWTRQIKLALKDKDRPNIHLMHTPLDAYYRWTERYKNLVNIRNQMNSRSMKPFREILLAVRSTYMRDFNKLLDETNFNIEEAESNVSYLGMIVVPCREIIAEKNLLEIPEKVLKILNIFKAIFKHSPYFNTPIRMSLLLQMLSHMILVRCIEAVDLDRILFKGHTQYGKKIIGSCIETCLKYKLLFKNWKEKEKWNLNLSSIFNFHDSFIQRCESLLEICNTMIIFGRMDESVVIPKPKFRSHRGEVFEEIIDKVELSFEKALNEIRDIKPKIFNVVDFIWHTTLMSFQAQIREIEIIMENLINEVFDLTSTLEEGIHGMFAFRNYMPRTAFRDIFNQKLIYVYRLFADALHIIKKDIFLDKNVYLTLLPCFSGRALLLILKKHSAERQRQMLKKTEWLGTCKLADVVEEQYQALIKRIDEQVYNYFENWKLTLNEQINEVLLSPILKWNNNKIEVNLRGEFVFQFREYYTWRSMKFEMPPSLTSFKDITKTEMLVKLYNKSITIVQDYNRIINELYPFELQLFHEKIKTCEAKLAPAFTTMRWGFDQSTGFISECFNFTNELQIDVLKYKRVNEKILKICEMIADTPFLKIETGAEFDLSKLTQFIIDQRNCAIEQLYERFQMIISCLNSIKTNFQSNVKSVEELWCIYISKIDILFEEALLLCIKNTMHNFLKKLHGENIIGPLPLITMKAKLSSMIIYDPTVQEVSDLIKNFHNSIAKELLSFPRIYQGMKTPPMPIQPIHVIILNDPDINEIQLKLNNELDVFTEQLEIWQQIWNPFREIWEINKEIFLQRFKKLAPPLESFNAEINKYKEFIKNLYFIETISDVYFILIDALDLKNGIIEHCNIWQYKLTQVLCQLNFDKIDNVYDYMEISGKKAKFIPKNLKEMQRQMAVLEKLISEVPGVQSSFPGIQDEFEVLVKQGFPIPKEMSDRLYNLENAWNDYLDVLNEAYKNMAIIKENFKSKLLEDTERLRMKAHNLLEEFYRKGPFTPKWKTNEANIYLKDIRRQMNILRKEETRLKRDLAIFNFSLHSTRDLDVLEVDLALIELVWELTEEWETSWERYKSAQFINIEIEELEDLSGAIYRKLVRLMRELQEKNWPIVEDSRKRVEVFRKNLPLILDLKNPAMRPRHWDRVRKAIRKNFDEKSASFTLDLIAELKLEKYADEISEISLAATMELQIENNLRSIKECWRRNKIEASAHGEKGVYQIKVSDEIFASLEDHLAQISTMKGTRFVDPFIKFVDFWEHTLSVVQEVLELVVQIQRDFFYLENIFVGEDIREQLPIESRAFDLIEDEWAAITYAMSRDENSLRSTHIPGLMKRLNRMIDRLEAIQRALERYLESKRHIFPRFYFISNDELLEILAHSKRPEKIQPHFKKLFDNINKIYMEKNVKKNLQMEAWKMISAEGEEIDFLRPVLLEGPVELWLCKIESMMHLTLQVKMKIVRKDLQRQRSERDKWIKEWPGQLCLTTSQILWTLECNRHLAECSRRKERRPLRRLRHKLNKYLNQYSEAIRGDLNSNDRLKITAMVTIEVHARDVVDNMYQRNVQDKTAFEWLAQLRFYWIRATELVSIRQTNTTSSYGYEYLGNSGRLAITPLTDRCYITLTTALHLHRGGSPKGPAGTGKTETVKDLGKSLAYYVIVINCSEGLDFKSIGKMFAGLAQAGAWGCFDEFNRINIEVLSVVAQQILSILSALSAHLNEFIFEGQLIKLKPSCGIFITMNPGYAGRTELPDNLKSMFRPIAMVVPDTCLIAEIVLFGEGFKDTRSLARKVFTMYSLCIQQLSKQFHYDFGVRAMVTLIRYAGRKRRQYPNIADEEILLLAMKDQNLSKLTSNDLPLFNGITNDLFPGLTAPTVDYEELSDTIYKSFIKMGMQPIPLAITKVLHLFETKNCRHSVMVLGQTCAAKSATWRCLRRSLTSLKLAGIPGYQCVEKYPLNPKSITIGELYGEYNLATNEWLDGVLSSIMRKVCAEETPDEKWIILDGPVDSLWIENMNSVMDDNKILTLINSERITMPQQVSLIMEVDDLSYASPATVSRNGMVFNDYGAFGWRPYVDSWLSQYRPIEATKFFAEYFERYVQKVLTYKRHNCVELVPIPELCTIISLCRLLTSFATKENGIDVTDPDNLQMTCKMWFFFCLVWSICATVNEDGRSKLDTYIRELEGIFPLKDTIYEYYFDPYTRTFHHWENKLPRDLKLNFELPFYKLVVPTIDTIRYQYIVLGLLKKRYPSLIIGSVGTGKTSIASSCLSCLPIEKYYLLTINMSAMTTSQNVQDIIESRVEKRTKGVFVPPGKKIMITFMDDFNMPAREIYGAQPPLELIRQWIDYNYWYDRRKQERKSIQEMILMASMGPPGGGRQVITPRLISRFNVINMTFPSDATIQRIFGSMLIQKLNEFPDEVTLLAGKLTESTLALYKAVIKKMLPTPAKMHYLFNLRDISRVFQGLLRCHRNCQPDRMAMLRLWFHECNRVFADRLIDENDSEWFMDKIGDQLGKGYDLSVHGLCGDEPPLFGHFTNSWQNYEDISNMEFLRNYLDGRMGEYNVAPGVVRLDIVLFKDAIKHLLRIIRIISQPRGHALLVGIGGSGRQSLTRFGSFICEYNVYRIEVSKGYMVNEFKEDLKKLYFLCGVKYQATTFLFSDTQVTTEAFLEIINMMLSSGEVPNLYKADEFEDIKNQLTTAAVKNKILLTNEAMFPFLIERVLENLHIVLGMSPIGDAFRNRLRQYPSLINSTTIDWYHEWPHEALIEVSLPSIRTIDFLATIHYKRFDLDPVNEDYFAAQQQEKISKSVSEIFATIHDSVVNYSKLMLLEMKRINYVTATNFLTLSSGYKDMLKVKRLETADAANKLRNGLYKIEETREKVDVMRIELKTAQVQVAEYQVECDNFLLLIAEQARETDETSKQVAEHSVRIAKEEVHCKRLADVAQADLAKAMPALEEAIRALDALNKKDMNEIRSYARPPKKVEMVLEAVMILKLSDPTWTEAKRQLADQYFLQSLYEFDKDNISDKTLKKIEKYTKLSDFQPDKVGIVSLAAKSLCMWVRAIEIYGKVYRIVLPKKLRFEEAQNILEEKQRELREAQRRLRELEEKLEQLKKEYEEKMKMKEELKRKMELLLQKLERAHALLEGLAGEKSRWEQTVEELDAFFLTLSGDCLLSTGFISYLGPFVSYYRDKLMNIWKDKLTEEEIPFNEKYSIVTFMVEPTRIREWNIFGLPSDDFSTENGIIVTNATRWPLLIDPQLQGINWLRRLEAKDMQVIDPGTPDFMKILENSIIKGKMILLQNVGEEIDPSVAPIVNKTIIKSGGNTLLKLSDKYIPYNNNFRLFLTTKLPNPHFSPEVSTKTTIVNFAVKEQGLQAQLLAIVVTKERPSLEEQKNELVMNIAAGKKLLKELENELLRLLFETKGSLLDDLPLLITLQTSQATSKAVTEQLITAETTEKEIDLARNSYRPCAQRATILFFVLFDMGDIDPMYQFSMDSYLNLFTLSIQKSPKSSILEQRIQTLNEYHTYAIYRYTCRGLFERHKLLFSFHMCVKILEGSGKMNINEYKFLLQGGVVLDREEQPDNPCTDWLTPEGWDNVTELDKLGGFHGVVDCFDQFPKDWGNWYTHPEPETQPLIGEWNDICNEFQRMLFVRALRPDRVPSCISTFVTNTLGRRFIEPPILDIRQVYDDSSCKTPLIFVLSPGVDPTNSLIILSETLRMQDRFQMVSLGQGQAPVATNLILQGIKQGDWVFLANCHLSLTWMPTLDKIVEKIQTTNVHQDFRLWLSSSPSKFFPISILQSGIKMTTEPPKGIKANLQRLYSQISEDRFELCENKFKYKKLLFSLCFFHAVLIERKKFLQLGWNIEYPFNDSDFEISENILSIYLDEYEDTPWDALKYLIGSVVYGGHITDNWDRRLILTYVNQYFCDDALNIPFFKLSTLDTYYIPRDSVLEHYFDYIALLPTIDRPEAFGQHSNADITSLISEQHLLFQTLMTLQMQSASDVGQSKEEKVIQIGSDVLNKLPAKIDEEGCDRNIGAFKTPLQVVLLQEISRFNILLKEIKVSLKNLNKGIKGFVVMSEELDEIFRCILEGRVPTAWLTAYPSLKNLGSWTRDLIMRIHHFDQWAETLKEPLFFWISAFTFPTGFLTAILQTTARKKNVPIDSLIWEFTVFVSDESLVIDPPREGVYVRGLFLESAGWKRKKSELMEPLPMQLVTPMPAIHFKPVKQLKKSNIVLYDCPVYYFPVRCGSTDRASYIVTVDLNSGHELAAHWVKRGTALLLSLSN